MKGTTPAENQGSYFSAVGFRNQSRPLSNDWNAEIRSALSKVTWLVNAIYSRLASKMNEERRIQD